MAEDDKKQKASKFTWGTFALALLAASTAVGEGVKSCNDRELAALEARDRVRVDKNIQKTSIQTFNDLYDRIEALEIIVDEQDEMLFELQVSDRANRRILFNSVPVSGPGEDDWATYEGYAGEEESPAESNNKFYQSVDDAEAEEEVIGAEHRRKKAAKKEERLAKPKPRLEFAEPRPQYDKAQEYLQQMQPRGKK